MKSKRSEYRKLTKVKLIDLLLERDAEIAELKAEVADLLAQYEQLDIQHSYLKKDKFGAKSEAVKSVAAPPSETVGSAPAASSEAEKPEPNRGHGVRKALPGHLTRNEWIDDSLCTCGNCGEPLKEGVTVRYIETLQVVGKQFYADRIGLPVKKCVKCGRPVATPPPSRIVPKGKLGDKLIANIAVEKHVNHRPLHWYRNEIINAGIPIGKGTVTNSMTKLAEFLRPMNDRMLAAVLAACLIQADDTIMPMKRDRKKEKEEEEEEEEEEETGGAAGKKKGLARGRAWHLYVDPRAFGGDGPRLLYIAASETWSKDTPQELLQDFTGILQTDAYPGWFSICDGKDGGKPKVHSLCLAHARRNFKRLQEHWELKNTGDPKHVRFVDRVLALFGKVFAVEEEIYGRSPEERLAVRQERSAPLMERMQEEFKRMRPKLAKRTNLARAINYMLKHWDHFTRFLTDGRIAVSTNGVEGMIRSTAKGRNMWMYAGSEEHAQDGAVISTFLQTARINGVDPEAWLLYVIERMPRPLTDDEKKDEEKVREWNEKYDALLPQNLAHVEELRMASPSRQPTPEALAGRVDPQSVAKGDQDSKRMQQKDEQDRDRSPAPEQKPKAANADGQRTQESKVRRKGANTTASGVPIIVKFNGLELVNAEEPWQSTRKLQRTRANKLTHANSNVAQKAGMQFRHEAARSPPTV